jgi:hypothetical protein
MKRQTIAALILIFAGIFVLFNSYSSITGLAILENIPKQTSYFVGVVLLIAGIVLFFLHRYRTIDDLDYEPHALERMEQRRIPPAAVKNAVERGEHYRLKNIENFGEAKGATDVYVNRGAAKTGPRGRYGETKEKNVLVLTGKEGEVKTTFLRNETETKSFLRKYVNKD